MHTQSQYSAAPNGPSSFGRCQLLMKRVLAPTISAVFLLLLTVAAQAHTLTTAIATPDCDSQTIKLSFSGINMEPGVYKVDYTISFTPTDGGPPVSAISGTFEDTVTEFDPNDTREPKGIFNVMTIISVPELAGRSLLISGAATLFQPLDRTWNTLPLTNGAGDTSFEVDCTLPPAIDIEKATNGVDADDADAGDAPQIAPGDPVTWSYVVTNSGGVPLANVTVFDDQIGPITCPQTTLDVAESMLCTATGIAEDLDDTMLMTVPGTCGSTPNRPLYENMGSATGTHLPTGEFVEDVDPSHYCNPEEPAIDIEKATNGVDADDPNAGDAPQIAAGNMVTWSYVVTNTGTVPLLNVQAIDETLGFPLNCPKTSLAAGESMICNSISLPAVQLEFGDPTVVPGTCGGVPERPLYENMANATGESQEGTFVQDADPSHYCNPPVCGLSVVKGCEIPPPPPPPVGQCDGKLQQFTMIWNGAGPITVSVEEGLTGSSQSSVATGDEVTFFTDGSTNDTIVNISGAVSGQSTFHVSCSDDDMDGDTTTDDDQQQVSPIGRDCAKDQGDGKGDSGFINQWLLEGFVDKEGAVLDCTVPSDGSIVSSCEFFTQPVNCETAGKPDNLTWQYTGGGCAASNNSQDSGDLFCTGSVDGTQAVTITDNGGNVFNVGPGESFTTRRDDSKVFTLTNAGGTEQNGRHVSCSQPIEAGDVYGSLTLSKLGDQGLGADVIYSYLISNTGAGTITGITAFDDKLGPVPGSPIDVLAPGDSRTLTAEAFVSDTVTNTVFVDGSSSSGADCRVSASATVTSLGMVPCDVSIVLDKVEDKKIKWKLTNNSSVRTATIESLTISWPGGESLKKIKYDGSDIFKGDLRSPPSTTVVESEWLKEVKDRRMKIGDSGKTLEIEFAENFPLKKEQPASDFDLTVTFSEGCSVTF